MRPPTAPLKSIAAMALESYRASRGFLLYGIVVVAGLLLVLAGEGLHAPLDRSLSLAGPVCHGGLCLIASLLAMALGAFSFHHDRQTGFGELLEVKPFSGTIYFLGRFLGLAARLTLVYAAAVVAAGLFLTLVSPDTRFAEADAAQVFELGDRTCPHNRPVLLGPGGAGACWTFSGLKNPGEQSWNDPGEQNLNDPGEQGLNDLDERQTTFRFKFRPRLPRQETIDPFVPVSIRVFQGENTRLEKRLSLPLRKSLELPVTVQRETPVKVALSVTGGNNLLEVEHGGCRWIQKETGPLTALVKAAIAALPILYLSLAVSLVFSAFVSTPTAFFATLVLGLLVLSAPSLMIDASLSLLEPPLPAAGVDSTDRETHWGAQAIKRALAWLPDPRAGGGIDPLMHGECPGRADITAPWSEIAWHLPAVLLIGCLLAGRRKR